MGLQKGKICEELKEAFKISLKNYTAVLRGRNELLKSCIELKEQNNNILNNQLEILDNEGMNLSNMTADAVPLNNVYSLEEVLNNLKSKFERLSEIGKVLNEKFEEDSENWRKGFIGIIKKEDISLKSYGEVQQALNDLTFEMDCTLKEMNEKIETFMKNLQKLKDTFLEFKDDISKLMPIDQDIKFEVQSCKIMIENKLKTLKLNSIEEANNNSLQAKELVKDIEDMKSKLNRK